MSETVVGRRSWIRGVVAVVTLVVAFMGLAWIGLANAEAQEITPLTTMVFFGSIIGAGLALVGAVVSGVVYFSPRARLPRRLAVTSLALAVGSWLVIWYLAPWFVPVFAFVPIVVYEETVNLADLFFGVGVALGAAVLAIVVLARRWARALPILALVVAFVPTLVPVLSPTLLALFATLDASLNGAGAWMGVFLLGAALVSAALIIAIVQLIGAILGRSRE